MASTKKEEILQPAQPKPSRNKGIAVPLVIVIVCLIIALLSQGGYITLPHFGLDGRQSETILAFCGKQSGDMIKIMVNGIEGGTVGVPYSYNPINNVTGCASPCTFYIEGSLPSGLALNPGDGSISGTPTAAGTSTFKICVKDAEGDEGCADTPVSLTVEPKTKPVRGNCPTKSNPPCHSVQNGGEIPVQTSGVIVYDYCECPSDTHYSGTTDVVTPGGPYKICICN
jgi:hypothetical protein